MPCSHISLVFITKNERIGSETLFPKVPLDAVTDAFVIDAGSTDGTVEFFRGHGLRVIQQQQRGLGAAVIEARRAAPGDAMIFFHPDGNEEPAEIPKFAQYLRAGYDFVVASRMIPGAWNEEDAQSWKPRKWTNVSLGWIARALWPSSNGGGSDPVNGFRAITCEAFDRLRLDRLDCSIDYQMVIRALKENLRTYEFPTREGHRIAGETNFQSLPTGWAELKMLGREIVLGRRYRR